MAFVLESPAFRNGEQIPRKYARDGENVSPPLVWQGAPPQTKSFALIVEDPDAPSGSFHHWAALDIPPELSQLREGVEGRAEGLKQGVNDFGDARYDGPQPPRGHGVHHYHFRLMALNVERLGAPEKASVREIWAKARPHALEEAELIGTFERK